MNDRRRYNLNPGTAPACRSTSFAIAAQSGSVLSWNQSALALLSRPGNGKNTAGRGKLGAGMPAVGKPSTNLFPGALPIYSSGFVSKAVFGPSVQTIQAAFSKLNLNVNPGRGREFGSLNHSQSENLNDGKQKNYPRTEQRRKAYIIASSPSSSLGSRQFAAQGKRSPQLDRKLESDRERAQP